MPVAGRVGGVFAATTVTTSTFTNAATTADAAKVRYSITDRTKSAWPLDAAITVKVNAVAVTTGFSIERAVGSVVFDVALTTEVVTITGTYQPVAELTGCYKWSFDSSVAIASNTDFIAARAGFETFMAVGLQSGKVTVGKFWDITGLRKRVGTTVLVKLYVSVATGEQYTGWAIITGSGSDADLSKPVDEPLGLQFTGGFFHRDSD